MAVKTTPERAPKSPKRTPRQPQKKGGFLRRYWWAFAAAPFVLLFLLLATLLFVYSRLDLPATPPPLQTTYILDREGNVLGTFHASVDRTIVPFNQMPKSLRDAVIAAEDQGFYEHSGIDPLGVMRAAWNDLIAHEVVQGGSTITMQLVKNVYAGHYETDRKTGQTTYVVPPRTFAQKVREALLAMKLERTYSKDEILAKYLNTIYFGHGAYGVEAAAQAYWGIHASELNMIRSATLAGLISSPSLFDPIDHPIDAEIRRNYVLDRMAALGTISPERAARLKLQDVRTRPSDGNLSFPPKLGYFLDYTKRALIAKYDEAQVFGGGLKVITGLDPQMQAAAEEAVAARLNTPGDPEAAVVAIDPATGEVRAMYGGRNWGTSQVNLATGDGGTGRQAGSAFKPFTLTAAMEANVSLSSRWYGPGTITIQDPRCYTDGQPWTLSNASDEESGTFSLATATAYSVNTVFAQVASLVGPDAVADAAHRMGIRSKLQPVCSITLGTQAVTPLEMTNAYATLAARGVRRWATPVHAVRDASGAVLDRTTSGRGKRVISTNDADLVTYALQNVIRYGTGTSANIGRPVAGKTGTAQDYVDAWFCGYVPRLATCVWIGYPKGEIPLENVEGYSAVYGGTIPALIWHDFMLKATERMAVQEFPTPSFEGYTTGAPTPPPSPSPWESPEPTRTPSPTPSPSPSPIPSPTESLPPSPTLLPTPSPSA
ncbi:MAG TPA: transglycosylase domain-containing protein [Actinomycetota bacterium]|nr:transglycosylase domain-containing protein [Actinomycetota bacterium]